MKLIIGLGNPGKKYELTKHNIGFLLIDQIADKYNADNFKERYNSLAAEVNINGEKVILIKPQTYMNLSGKGVAPFLNFYKLTAADIIVIYDDLDLAVGKIRLRPKGGAGGHNGIKSLIQALGTEEFQRLKVGIGRPPQGWQTADYVLSKFTDEEWPLITEAIKEGVAAVEKTLEQGIEVAMNSFN